MPQRANILIVEDEAVLALDLCDQLTAYGYNVVGPARTGSHALALFQAHRVDLILCDIGLAGDWDGVQTTTKLIQWRPAPVIYLTGHTDRDLFIRAQSTRPAAYLLKPWESGLLRRVIQTALTPEFPLAMASFPMAPPVTNLSVGQRQPNQSALDKLVERDIYFLSQNDQFVRPSTSQLLYLQADLTTTTVITADQAYRLSAPLPSVLHQLANRRLIRTHRTFAVHVDQVQSFNEWEVRVGNRALPLGRVYRDAFLAYFSHTANPR